MKNAVMTDAAKGRRPGREKGSILVFALTVLFFFSGLAVFLKTMLDSQVFIESKDAEYAAKADLLLDSGFEAYGVAFTQTFVETQKTDEPRKRVADALNGIGRVSIKAFGTDNVLTQVGVFYTSKKDLSVNDMVISPDGKGWHIKTNNDLTWHLELADGTKLTRKAPVNLYVHGS